MVADFHLHTSASDGELDPGALVAAAASRGVRALAITDHDTLAAYRGRDGAVSDEAMGMIHAAGGEAVLAHPPPELLVNGDAERFISALRAAGEALGLRFTRGSDAHGPADLDRVCGPAPA